MKIEKKKVVKSSKLSYFAKSAVATALGFAASIGTTACDDSISATGGDKKTQEPEPTCGEVACGEQFSSSSYTDIKSSQERLSSSSLEALSSAATKLSSNSLEPPISSGVPHVSTPTSSESASSSSVAPVSSSLEEPIMLSGDIAPFEDSSSSVEAASSSSEAESSSSHPSNEKITVEPEILIIEPNPEDTTKEKHYLEIRCDKSDSTSYNARLCEDSHGFTILSMVTTFEQDDVQA